jgi:hypothetical protein
MGTHRPKPRQERAGTGCGPGLGRYGGPYDWTTPGRRRRPRAGAPSRPPRPDEGEVRVRGGLAHQRHDPGASAAIHDRCPSGAQGGHKGAKQTGQDWPQIRVQPSRPTNQDQDWPRPSQAEGGQGARQPRRLDDLDRQRPPALGQAQ